MQIYNFWDKTSTRERVGNITVKFGGTVLEQVDRFKYLGVILDSGLTFQSHVKYLKSKLYAKIKLLGRVRMLLDRNTTPRSIKRSYCWYLTTVIIYTLASPHMIGKFCRNCKIAHSGQYSMSICTHTQKTHTLH